MTDQWIDKVGISPDDKDFEKMRDTIFKYALELDGIDMVSDGDIDKLIALNNISYDTKER